MLKDLFEEQRRYVNYFFDHVDLESIEALLKRVLDSSGMLFFTGVGKSGFVSEKIATTMMSTGTRALFLPPVNLLHGDLGIISKDDIVFLISKSGETEELLQLVLPIRAKGAYLVSLVCNTESRLSKACDLSICLPLERELCPFDLVPTTSADIQLIFGDILAVALMKAKKFTLDDYAMNHPAGRIGKRVTCKVSDLMLVDGAVPYAKPQDKLVDVLVELSDKRCGCLLIVDDKRQLLGIFTDGDLRRSLQTKGSNVLEEKMEALMTHKPKAVSLDALAWEAMKIMESKREVMVLPVLDGKHVVGLIKMHDIIQSGL